jgi:hypothetical protein
VPRQFRVWGKKRGSRRTGSRLIGRLGEGVFSAVLFLIGTILLTALLTSYVSQPRPEMLRPGFGFWLTVLVLVSLMLLGGGGVARAIRLMTASAERRSALARRKRFYEIHGQPPKRDLPTVPNEANLINSPGVRLTYRLPANQSPAWRLIASMVFCLIWNGAAAILLVLAGQSFFDERPEWFLTLFTVPFLMIGGWAIFDFIRQMLIHTGIGPTNIEITDQPFHPGGRYRLYLSQSGRLSVRFLTVNLVCEEQATYRQGTDLRAETKKVFDRQLFRETDFTIEPGIPFEREAEFEVPPTAMHSFQSEHNALSWKLVVHGNVESWPPFERIFPVVIHPC